jgi:hypothetical protein
MPQRNNSAPWSRCRIHLPKSVIDPKATVVLPTGDRPLREVERTVAKGFQVTPDRASPAVPDAVAQSAQPAAFMNYFIAPLTVQMQGVSC